jgi:uncharacterized membrane protein
MLKFKLFKTDSWKLSLIILAYFSIFSTLDLLRLFSFTQNSNDVAVFDQAVWYFIHGKGFYDSIEGMNHLGVHFSPIFGFLAPIYALFPYPSTLILCQAAAGAVSIIPIFLIAKKIFNDKNTALFFALLFSLNHVLHGVTWDLLNELAYAIPFLLLAYYFFLEEKYVMMWGMLLLAIICKEEIGLTVGFFGLYLSVIGYQKTKKSLVVQGIALFILGMGWSFLCVDFFIPFFRNAPYQYLSSEDRYAVFGAKTLQALLLGIISHPILAIQTAFTLPKTLYCLELLAPLAFISLIAPGPLFMMIPTLSANLLSGAAMMSMTGNRYPAVLIPFIFISAMYGTRKIASRSKTPDKTLRKILRIQFIFTILCTLLFSSTPLSLRISKFPWITSKDQEIRKLISQIPAGALVSAQPDFTGLIPHGCIVKPFYWKGAQYVVMDPFFNQWYQDFKATPKIVYQKGFHLEISRDGLMIFVRH